MVMIVTPFLPLPHLRRTARNTAPFFLQVPPPDTRRVSVSDFIYPFAPSSPPLPPPPPPFNVRKRTTRPSSFPSSRVSETKHEMSRLSFVIFPERKEDPLTRPLPLIAIRESALPFRSRHRTPTAVFLSPTFSTTTACFPLPPFPFPLTSAKK